MFTMHFSIGLWMFILCGVQSTYGSPSRLSAREQLNTFIKPTAWENVSTNQEYCIEWNVQTPGPVWIQLSYDEQTVIANLTASTPNTGNFTWIPPDVYAGKTQYFLTICDVNLPADSCAYSPNRFALVDPSSSVTTSLSLSATSPTSSSSSSPTAASEITSSSNTATTTVKTLPSQTSQIASTSTPSPGLSVTAKVAVGVAVPVVTIAIVALLTFFLIRKRRNAQHQLLNSTHGDWLMSNGDGALYFKAELPADVTPQTYLKNGGDVVELPNNERDIELPGSEMELAHELSANNSSR